MSTIFVPCEFEIPFFCHHILLRCSCPITVLIFKVLHLEYWSIIIGEGMFGVARNMLYKIHNGTWSPYLNHLNLWNCIQCSTIFRACNLFISSNWIDGWAVISLCLADQFIACGKSSDIAQELASQIWVAVLDRLEKNEHTFCLLKSLAQEGDVSELHQS